MFYKNGIVTNVPFHSINHYASLPQYTEVQKAWINDLCASCAKSYVRGRMKNTSDEIWFGALDVFQYIQEKHTFTNDHPLIKKWAEDWQIARLKERPDVDIDKSIKSQLGKIFCDALHLDKNATYKWRRVEGKYFEYCRIK